MTGAEVMAAVPGMTGVTALVALSFCASPTLRSAAPFYEAFGGRRMRLLQNVDDPARFIHEIEYDTHEVIELNRQRVASDPQVQAYLRTWRSFFPGSVEIDVYQEAV